MNILRGSIKGGHPPMSEIVSAQERAALVVEAPAPWGSQSLRNCDIDFIQRRADMLECAERGFGNCINFEWAKHYRKKTETR